MSSSHFELQGNGGVGHVRLALPNQELVVAIVDGEESFTRLDDATGLQRFIESDHQSTHLSLKREHAIGFHRSVRDDFSRAVAGRRDNGFDQRGDGLDLRPSWFWFSVEENRRAVRAERDHRHRDRDA